MRAESDDDLVSTSLYRDHRRALYGFALGRTGEPQEALDVLQETFLRAWRNLSTLRGLTADRQRTWLFAVARNLLVDSHRRTASGRSALEGVARQPWGTQPADPAGQAELWEQLDRVDAAVRSLPVRLRTVLAMHVVGEMTSAQIGALLDEPAGTVRYHLSQARRQVAAMLAIHEGDQK